MVEAPNDRTSTAQAAAAPAQNPEVEIPQATLTSADAGMPAPERKKASAA